MHRIVLTVIGGVMMMAGSLWAGLAKFQWGFVRTSIWSSLTDQPPSLTGGLVLAGAGLLMMVVGQRPKR